MIPIRINSKNFVLPTAVRVKPRDIHDKEFHFTVYTACTDSDMAMFTLRTNHSSITGQMILERYITAVNSKKRSFDFESIVEAMKKEIQQDELEG